eukprot:gnl/TRDRNA2_/TRDRNA2_170191_c0_seq1.p1 gnl/TRDRNA2_/TRDRNA2_170191_c0~~gnl/TRDRNA2_/TRDRNA2_170191_c0_seq1.p1  ORF type:complete len:193 (-),score=54.33 gnl/TRDRNA2_/TRDRNA2_170191_c0_seq1:34-612(-)
MGNIVKTCICCNAEAHIPDPPSEKDVLDDLEMAENKIWKIAFAQIDGERQGKVSTEHELLKFYIGEASSCTSPEEIERILTAKATDGYVNLQALMEVLRQHPFDDAVAIQMFQQLGGGMEQIESMDARSALLNIGQSHLRADGISEEVWDKVLNVVMQDADLMVDMEWWVARCKLFARYVRALKQVQTPILC